MNAFIIVEVIIITISVGICSAGAICISLIREKKGVTNEKG